MKMTLLSETVCKVEVAPKYAAVLRIILTETPLNSCSQIAAVPLNQVISVV